MCFVVSREGEALGLDWCRCELEFELEIGSPVFMVGAVCTK